MFLKDIDPEESDSLGGNDEAHQSFDSEDLIEISKYYENRDSYKYLKSEIEDTRHKLRKLPKNSKTLRVLFRKTLEKLKKYKND